MDSTRAGAGSGTRESGQGAGSGARAMFAAETLSLLALVEVAGI